MKINDRIIITKGSYKGKSGIIRYKYPFSFSRLFKPRFYVLLDNLEIVSVPKTIIKKLNEGDK